MCSILSSLVVLCLRIESSDTEQIEHLLVHLLLRVDERIDHLFRIAVYRRQIHREINARCIWRALDIHETIYADIVAGERATDVQVAQWHSVHHVFSLKVESRFIWISTEVDGSSRQELEVLLDNVLDSQLINTMIHHIVAKHIK